MASQNEVRADSDGQHPIVGLYNKNLGHETIVAAEIGLLWSADGFPVNVQRRRAEEVEGHEKIANGKAINEAVTERA